MHVLLLFFGIDALQSAWLGKEKELPVFGDGQNVIPSIHVDDLAKYVYQSVYMY